ncbi:hypothetical protein AC739_17875 [Planococcus glaciei]|uniref:antibiotic biosynthesis monooxygenase family protein n=1 Tax=Planococcus glaciei TaxID=459472 RepID=UPI0003DF481C|nr:antibiotic biosynthesis monooxygenase [Planococcus glaciei]ETP68012.1 hypothetical protein G159_14450 [Planococcus glaciei CHR43]KOF08884.1 hypothetical protein AC739_17875 [Planococcus glaciei]
MFVQSRKMTITEGNSHLVLERFSKPGILEKQEGFVDMKVLQKKVRRGEEEVLILVTWESEAHWKQWEKSDVHIAGHKANLNKPKPAHILNVEVAKYEVKAVKTAVQEN